MRLWTLMVSQWFLYLFLSIYLSSYLSFFSLSLQIISFICLESFWKLSPLCSLFVLDQQDKVFLQQRWVYLGFAENCNSRSTTMVSHMEVFMLQEKQNSFIEGRKDFWECYGKQRFHDFSLANLLPEKKRSLYFQLGSAPIAGHKSSPFWSPNSV